MTSPVATASSASRIAAAFSAAGRVPSKTTIAARPAGIESVGTTSTGFSAARAACSADRITFELFGSRSASGAATDSTAATRSAVEGFMLWPPSTTRAAPRLSKIARFPSPATTATTSLAFSPTWSRRSSRRSVCRCMFAISIPSSTPCAPPALSAAPGSSVCTCTFSALRSPTTSSESPSGSSSPSNRSASRSSPSTTKTVQ